MIHPLFLMLRLHLFNQLQKKIVILPKQTLKIYCLTIDYANLITANKVLGVLYTYPA